MGFFSWQAWLSNWGVNSGPLPASPMGRGDINEFSVICFCSGRVSIQQVLF